MKPAGFVPHDEPRTLEEMNARVRLARARMSMSDRPCVPPTRPAAPTTGPALIARTIYLPGKLDAALAIEAAQRGTDARGIVEAVVTEALRLGLVGFILGGATSSGRNERA